MVVDLVILRSWPGSARSAQRLRNLAYVEDRAVTGVIREAIHDYIQRKASHDKFAASLERAMQENARSIADLAGYWSRALPHCQSDGLTHAACQDIMEAAKPRWPSEVQTKRVEEVDDDQVSGIGEDN